MMQTTWGYTLTNSDNLPDLVSLIEFTAFTGGKFGSDVRIAPNVKAASTAIRNYCGWHIAPNLECEMVYRVYDLRDAFIGSDLLIQLPATFVTNVSSVLLNAVKNEDVWVGDETTDFDFEKSGLLRLYDIASVDKRSKIRVVFNSGLNLNQIDLLKELASNRVTHALVSSYGVASESAGGVSITYNSSWAGNTRSTALPDDNKEVLNPYRVKGVF